MSQRGASDEAAFKGSVHRVYSVDFDLREVMWSLKELAFKVILDLGCMRSVVGVLWANEVLQRWHNEGRWYHIEKECEAFKFGGGEVLNSKYRLSFVGSFVGRPVIYGFSIVEGKCPPLFSRSGCTQLGAVIDCERHAVSSRKLGVRTYGVGRESGHYTMSVDECDVGSVKLPEDFSMALTLGCRARVRRSFASQARSPRSRIARRMAASGVPLCKLCNSPDHKTRQCPTIIEDSDEDFKKVDTEMPDSSTEGDLRRRTAGPRPQTAPIKGRRTPQTPSTASTLAATPLGATGLTMDEVELLRKRRERQAVAKAKAVQSRALTGVNADYPSLSHAWSYELAYNVTAALASTYAGLSVEEGPLAASGKASDRGRRGQAMEAEPTLAEPPLCQGDRSSVGPLRGHEAEDQRPGRLAPDVKNHRPNRGLTQRLKAGVRTGKEVTAAVHQAVAVDSRWRVMELFAVVGILTLCAGGRPGWVGLNLEDWLAGRDLRSGAVAKELFAYVEKEMPDLLVLNPPGDLWSSTSRSRLEEEALWEERRRDLPLWRLCRDLWQLQVAQGRKVVLLQPANSEAFQLNYMLEREGVCRATVCLCAFGLQDPENGKPYYGKMAVDVNDGTLARELMRQAHCSHKPHEHQPLRGSARLGTTRVSRTVCAAVWPKAWCERLLEACEKSWSSEQQLGDDWSLCNATCGTMWETVAVSSSSVPEENLREELAKQSMTGERYDYITFSGTDLQQPRRLRSMVAHLHVTMGHLSNERLARMLSLTGAAEGIVGLARGLRCQVCAMVRPPQAQPQVAYRKPRAFNERLSGDTFFIWDSAGQKFAVTHFIDGLTDYHLGDLTDRPDSTFAREVLQDVW